MLARSVGETSMRVGVEVGGTFTDLVAVDGDRVRIAKVPSVPARPDEGAMAALAAADIPLGGVDDLVHGSTVATNAILERKGAPTAFLVTKGFRDLLFLQRHNRRRIYDLFYKKPVPVVERRNCFEIDERIDAEGAVITALDEAAVGRQIERIFAAGAHRAVAICLINGYANPAHERALAGLIGDRFPDLAVTCSSDVTREFREYERASTTTLAAYVQPVIDSYLTRFRAALDAHGFAGRFSVMQSNGGRLPARGMSRNAITSLYSGPAAGVIGAVAQAGRSGVADLITLDMGGTSTDVCLVAGGAPALSTETEVDGLPIRTPVLDIVTVGAGGGSIVWVDDGGMLRVGPRSAGADPGPAGYGRGGRQPTVTDAHLVRGSIRTEAFLGGRMRIDLDASRRAFADLAERFAMSVERVCDSAVRVADGNIVRAIQLVSTERGRDPRDYVLVPFGGAGPLHAAAGADALGIRSILVPPCAGVLSAFGLLAADFVLYETRTRRVPVDDGAPGAVRTMFEKMRTAAAERFAALELTEALEFTHILEMRHVGQAFEVAVPLGAAELATLSPAMLADRFAAAHHQVFAFGEAGAGRVEIVSFRLGIASPTARVPVLHETGFTASAGTGRLFDRGETLNARLLNRPAVGDGVVGPALVEDVNSTIYIPPGWQGRLDDAENLRIERAP